MLATLEFFMLASDPILAAKIDGLASVMDTRFKAHEKEQAGVVAWMERLANGVDRIIEMGSTMTSVQHRISAVEHATQDQALDIDGLDTRMSDIESHRKADSLRSSLTKWGLGATGGALVAYAVQAFLGK